MNLKNYLKRIPGLVKLYRFLRAYLPDTGNHGFHGDRVFQTLFCELISSLPITSFVETGTYLGDSTCYVASRYNKLQVFSCEINDEFFKQSKHRLKRFRNVELHKAYSQDFIRKLGEDKRLGNLPLFFLDAHWYDYWPLEYEIRAINILPCAIVIIDDFEVPGRPDFGFDVGGGGSPDISGKTVKNSRKCNLYLIRPQMALGKTYNALFPYYNMKEAFPEGEAGTLRGHIVIFQNLKDRFEALKQRDFISQHYKEFEIL